MMQVKKSDGQRFSYGRDIIQLFPRIGQLASNLLVMQGFPPAMKKWAEESGCTQPDFVKAAIALAKYTSMSRTPGVDKPAAWVNSGLADLSQPVQVVLFFFIGTVVADLYLQASLEAMPVGQTPWGADRLGEMAERIGFAAQAGSERQKQERLADAHRAADGLQDNSTPFSS